MRSLSCELAFQSASNCKHIPRTRVKIHFQKGELWPLTVPENSLVKVLGGVPTEMEPYHSVLSLLVKGTEPVSRFWISFETEGCEPPVFLWKLFRPRTTFLQVNV